MKKSEREFMAKKHFEKLAKTYRTPQAVQGLLKKFRYNSVDTVMSAHSSWKAKKAHCFEAALIAAAILEHSGYEPLVVFIDSKDYLGHVLFIFKQGRKWGSVARSRDAGLHGRRPVFSSLDALVQSYWEPYVDKTGWITAYSVTHLDDLPFSWRSYPRNMWANEKFLTSRKQKKCVMPKNLHAKALALFLNGNASQSNPTWW